MQLNLSQHMISWWLGDKQANQWSIFFLHLLRWSWYWNRCSGGLRDIPPLPFGILPQPCLKALAAHLLSTPSTRRMLVAEVFASWPMAESVGPIWVWPLDGVHNAAGITQCGLMPKFDANTRTLHDRDVANQGIFHKIKVTIWPRT